MTVDPLMSVGLVLLLLLAALSWLARKLPGGSLSAARERVSLTPQHSVHVIEIGGLRLLVGTGPSGAPQVLARLGEVEVEVEDPQPEPRTQPLFPRSAGASFGLGRLGAAR